jgi:RNA polymerase sigma-70 factor, ECF subfamily
MISGLLSIYTGATMEPIHQTDMLKQAFKYQAGLTSYAYGILRDWSLAKDAVQDAFVTLVEKHEDYDPALGIYPWVKRMVHFKALEICRKRKKEVFVEDEELNRLVGETLDNHVAEEDVASHNLRLSALHACMGQLQDPLRFLLVSFYWERKSCEQIAPIISRNAASLRVTLMRARSKLRECMVLRLKNVEGLS